MFTEKRRAITVCLVGVVLNTSLSIVARLLNLPLWLDTTGTIYTAMILGFPYGFIVGLINNLFWTVATNGYNSFAYYFVSIAVAYLAAKLTSQPTKLASRKFFIIFVGLFAVGSLVAIFTTFLVDSGVPNDYWSQVLRLHFIESGNSSFISSVFAIAIVKANDTFISLVFVMLSIACTPIKYRDKSFVMR